MKVLSPAFIGNIFEIKKISRGNLTIRRFFWVLLWIWPTIQPFTSRHMDHNISTFFFLSPIKLHQRRFSLKYTVMIIFRMINAPALCKPRVLVLRPNILVSMFVSSLATQNLARIKFKFQIGITSIFPCLATEWSVFFVCLFVFISRPSYILVSLHEGDGFE